jgi:NAD(P)-dependent dehydrogenase (short-subunit alcohol dehydrogenase family)
VRVVSVNPGEMNTRMHADALPDADPATLADPDQIARRLAALIAGPERLTPTGARVELAGVDAGASPS